LIPRISAHFRAEKKENKKHRAQHQAASRLNLDCAGTTALWNWQTCLPVGKRRHVAALQIRHYRTASRLDLRHRYITLTFL
jgi:hypothetical protein